MRIISVRPAPVARVFALIYAVCGLVAFIQYAVSGVQTFILPIGILMGVFHLDMDFPVGRSPDLIANAFLCIGAVLSYALSGWITGVALTLCLNFVAHKTGGIDGKFVTVAEDASAPPLKFRWVEANRAFHSVESRGVTRLESMNLSNALSSLWVDRRPMSNSKPLLQGKGK